MTTVIQSGPVTSVQRKRARNRLRMHRSLVVMAVAALVALVVLWPY